MEQHEQTIIGSVPGFVVLLAMAQFVIVIAAWNHSWWGVSVGVLLSAFWVFAIAIAAGE